MSGKFRNVKIRVNTPEINEQVQKKLYEDGCFWICFDGLHAFRRDSIAYLFVNDEGRLGWCGYGDESEKHFIESRNTEVQARDVITGNPPLTPKDLIPGKHAVRLRKGDMYYVMADGLLVPMLTDGTVKFLCNYQNDLRSIAFKQCDIVRVYEIQTNIKRVKQPVKSNLVWERNEKPQYTFDQLRGIIGHDFDIVD